jgi:hypothetical protein
VGRRYATADACAALAAHCITVLSLGTSMARTAGTTRAAPVATHARVPLPSCAASSCCRCLSRRLRRAWLAAPERAHAAPRCLLTWRAACSHGALAALSPGASMAGTVGYHPRRSHCDARGCAAALMRSIQLLPLPLAQAHASLPRCPERAQTAPRCLLTWRAGCAAAGREHGEHGRCGSSCLAPRQSLRTVGSARDDAGQNPRGQT